MGFIKNKQRRGSALVMVLGVMIFVTIASSLIVALTFNNRHQAVHQSESIQLYYMTMAGLDSTLEALTNERGIIKVSDYERRDPMMLVPDIEFRDNSGNLIGKSVITVKRTEKIVGSNTEAWIEIASNTTLRDIRGGSDLKKNGRLSISVKNPLLQEYDLVAN